MTPLARRCLSELVGTFLLVFIGPGAVMINARTNGGLGIVGIALAFACVVTAVVAALGHVSGAHINPAVTVTLWQAKRFPPQHVVPYITAQCLGAVAASLVLRMLLGDIGKMGATLPAVSVARALVIELLLSFFLMLVIRGVTDREHGIPSLVPFAIGLTVGGCALVGGPLTGASMNPARSLGPAVAGGYWHAHWVYWLAPIAGMIMASVTYETVVRLTHGLRPSTIPR